MRHTFLPGAAGGLLAVLLTLSPSPAHAADTGRPVSATGDPQAIQMELLRRIFEPLPETPPEPPALPQHLQPCQSRFEDLGRVESRRTVALATLPDPIDSPFRRETDAFLLSIQQAMSQLGFVGDLECLPWRTAAPADEEPVHRRYPGALLFRRDAGIDPDGAAVPGEVVALLVVGETPRGGVHARAMESALELAGGAFAGTVSEGEEPPPIKILGPTFSGSVKSIATALRRWSERPADGEEPAAERPDRPRRKVIILSGSATNTGLGDVLTGALEGLPLTVDFRTVQASNSDLQSCVWNRLVPESLGLDTAWRPPPGSPPLPPDHPCLPTTDGDDNRRVALLVESSAYGNQFTGSGFHVIPISPYLRSLRAAYQESGGGCTGSLAATDTQGAPTARPESLPLDLGLGHGETPAFDLQGTLSSQDLVLSDLLRELSRKRVEAVGIITTNTLDKLFLTQSLARFAPDVRMITVEGDILMTHPCYRRSTNGMIVASSQPLREPEPFGPRGDGIELRFDFDSSQGMYLAVQELLGADTTHAPERPGRAVWISVVGQGGFQALQRIELSPGVEEKATGNRIADSSEQMEAVTGIDGADAGRLPRIWWLALTIVTLVLALAILQVGRQWAAHEPLFGLVPLELVRPLGWKKTGPDPSARKLHALVAVVPVMVATPYLILALPAVVGSSQGYSASAIAQSNGMLLLNVLMASLAGTCLAALILSAAGLLGGLSLRTGRDLAAALARRGEAVERRVLDTVLPWLFAAGVTILAVTVAVYWFQRTWGDQRNGVFMIERSLNLGSGMSPLLPALLMATVPVVWIIISLYRHRVAEELPKRGELEDWPSPEDRHRLERIEQLRQAIDPGALWQGARGPWVLLVVIPLIYLALFYGLPATWPLRSMEGPLFDMTVSLLFTVAILMVVASGISLHRGWTALRALLDWLKGLESALPSREKEAAGGGVVSLSTAYAAAADSRRKAGEDRKEAWNELQEAVERADREGLNGPEVGLAALLSWSVVNQRPVAALMAVARWLEEAAKARLRGLGEGGDGNGDGEAGDAKEARPVPDAERAAGTALVAAADTFFVRCTACFLRDIHLQLIHLMGFMTVGLIVLLVAVNVYPFEPQRVLVLYLGGLITLGAVLSGTVVLQADRDRLLTSLSGSSGQNRWNMMARRLALYAGVPMVSLLASRFPAVREVLGNWIEPLFKALM